MSTAGSTVILPCTCESKYQDEQHGKGRHVHNIPVKKDNRQPRCTVCGQERSRK